VRVDDAGDRHPAAGEFLHHEGVGEQRLAEPTELLGDGETEQAHLAHALDDVGRVLVGVLQPLGVRDDLLLREIAHGGEDVALHLGQTGRLGEPSHSCLRECTAQRAGGWVTGEYGRKPRSRPMHGGRDALCEISPNAARRARMWDETNAVRNESGMHHDVATAIRGSLRARRGRDGRTDAAARARAAAVGRAGAGAARTIERVPE
jgi:hypothetical protein